MTDVDRVTVGGMFFGYGGLELALAEILPTELLWVAEIDPAACAVIDARWGVPNLGDVTKVNWGTVPAVDVLTLGFPCQDVSIAGNRAGIRDGTRSGLWAEAVAAIRALKPGMVVIENVRGLLSADAFGYVESCPWCLGDTATDPPLRALGAVLGDLASLGFDAEWESVRASDVGACHGRWRVFVTAYPNSGGYGREEEPRRVGAVDVRDAYEARERERARTLSLR